MDEIYLSANLTLKPGLSDSFKVGIKTEMETGSTFSTEPLQILKTFAFGVRPTLLTPTWVTVLNCGRSFIPPPAEYEITSPTFNWLLKSATDADLNVSLLVILNWDPSGNTCFLRSKTVFAANVVLPDPTPPIEPLVLWTALIDSISLSTIAVTLLPESIPFIISGSLIWNSPFTSRRVIEVLLVTAETTYPADPLNLPFT